MHEQTRRNLDYYNRLDGGRADYWRYMPAPRFRARVIAGVLAGERPASILDLGCGDGMLLSSIHEVLPDAKLAGIDLSRSQIEENRRSMPDIDWFVGNIESEDIVLPRRFDALTASEVIEHLPHPGEFLRSVRRIAADDALLVLSTQSGPIGETEVHVGHLRHFRAEEMVRLLEENGWQPVRVWNAGFPFQDLSKWVANLSPDTMMEHFGVRPYGPVQKMVASFLRILFLFNSNSHGAQLFAVARRRPR